MSKSKNKGSKKEKPASDLPASNFLDSATVSLQKFRRFAKQVKKLSTTQKVVGSLALLAAGYVLISNSTPNEAPPKRQLPVGQSPTPPPATEPGPPNPSGTSLPAPPNTYPSAKSAHEKQEK